MIDLDSIGECQQHTFRLSGLVIEWPADLSFKDVDGNEIKVRSGGHIFEATSEDDICSVCGGKGSHTHIEKEEDIMGDLLELIAANLGTLENDVNIRLDGLEKRLERLEQLVQHSEYIKSVGE